MSATKVSRSNAKSKASTAVRQSKKPQKSPVETQRPSESKTASKKRKKDEPVPDSKKVVEDAEESKEEGGNEGEEKEEDDEEIMLEGFSSSSDSSDEEDGVDHAPVDLGKLPTIAKDDATLKRKLEKAKRQQNEQRGVIYLGRIPHGFYEDQMKGYFSQFGEVTRLRLSRNKTTGGSKHYGFVEFSSADVAEIVAETMDNYLLLGHILRCRVIPKEEVHPQLWIGSNKKFRRVPMDRLSRLQQNKDRNVDERKRVEVRLLKRQAEKKRRLEAAGIDYDLDSVGYKKIKA